ncbi:MAG TPA: hypothetical protein VLF94_07880 [Chlamydiales bacterium]|nr:hypothetical protein [Chlamydiales bacterium]
METLKSDKGGDLKDYKGKFASGGTGWAYDVGSRARTLDDLKAFRSAREVLTEAGTAAMKAKDYTKAMDLLTRAQFAREAYEWATGVKMDNNAEEGSAETVRQNKPDSAPPIPGGEAGKAPVVPGELHHGQFSPSENPRAIRTAAIEDEKGNRFEGPMHLLAYSKALEAGFAAQDLGNFTEGFLTNDGKFLNRKQAFDRAQELGQIKTEFAGRTTLTSEHMRAEGSPELKGQFAPNEDLQEVAGDYAQGNDELKYERTGAAVPVPTDTAKKIADFYQAAKHSPDDPEVRRSYSALNNETGSQYDALVNAGYKIEPWTKEGEPYANSEAMMADVRDNKHLFYRPTNADLTDKSNRMLDPVIGMKGTPINDIFRAVHDIFGHAKEGYGFGPKGEFNAWRAHSAMYSEDAQGALAAETLGQNSWVNYGEHLRNEQGNVPVKGEPGFKGLTERPFAEQKNIVLPPELMAEAKGQFQPGEEKPEDELKVARQFWVDSKGVTHPAYGGHMEEAYKIFPKTKTEAEGEISKIYPMMFQKGNVRGLYRLAPDPYLDLVGNGWSTLSTATQSEIKRISQSLNIPVEYNGRPIETGVEPLQKREAQFSPGKNKEDWEFKKSPGTAFSKAWILPNGVPWQLGGQWHHEALNENPDIAKKYGISATDSSEENRVDALKKGFARVNMGMHNGLLTIEARAADWRKLKPSVERMVDENLNSIDKITVNLMNPKVDKVVDSRTGVLFDKDTPAEKMENIPFVTLGEVRGQFQPGKPGADRDRPVFDERSLRKAISSVYPVRSTDQWGTREAIEQPKLTTELVEQLKREFPNVSEDSIRDNIDSAFGRNGWNVEPTEAEALFKKIAPLFRAQFAPSFEHKDFESELEKIRSGKSGGQTFTTSGAVWTPKNPKVDIVSLASVNVPQGDLTKENFLDAVAPYEALLGEHPNLVAGAFSFSKEGIPTVSIDINAVVPQKFRANTLKFAKDNEQRAIWNVDKGENIDAGGNGNTRLNSPEEILDAVDPLLRGKSVSVDDILKQNTAGELPGEQGTFEGIGTKEPISSAALGSLTKAELAKQYPEAVIARRRGEPIDSNIKSSPLAKEAGSEEAAIDAFARRLVEFSKEYQNDPIFKSGAKWYEDFVPQLKKEFGEHAQLMAELLAATSPRTDVASNYAYALDALEGFKSGRFKKTIAKFEEGLKKFEDDTWHSWYNKELKAGNIPNPPKEPTPAAFMAQWIYKNNLKPTQSNGKLYGTHSIRLLQVFARRWNDLNTGPKTRTFVSNLLGTGHDATIDVWADRTMRRLGYAGFEDRWRILPQNAAPVSDEDFYFSQKAFAKAAKELGMKPDALQGALWFAEKDHWAKNGWARLDLGSFQTELEKTAMLKQGIQQRSAVSKADQKAKTAEPLELGISVEPRNIKK